MANLSGKLTELNHCADSRELAVRFALWAHGLNAIPSADRIRVHFRMSRATAYRWRAAYCAAIGVPSHNPRERRLTDAELRKARKLAVDLRRAIDDTERCQHCVFFRMHPSGSWWGFCTTHHFPVRASHTCNTFRSTQKAGGKRLSTIR